MKKLGLIILSLVMAISVIGVGYAAWTDQLFIDGTVTTGNFGVIFSASSPETDTDPYAQTTCVISDDGKTATFKVTGAYPGYTGTASLTIENTGTVPATLAATDGLIFTATDNNGIANNITLDSFTLNGNIVDPTAMSPTAIEPGETAEFIATVTFGDDVPQDATATFDITLNFVPAIP